jgi:Tfp pilus assembly protein PilN
MINLNLLPPEIKEQQAQVKKNKQILNAFVYSIVALLFVGFAFLGLTYYFNAKLENTNRELGEKEKSVKKYGDIEDRAKKVTERIDTVKRIIDGTNLWSSLIEEIQKIMPDGISLSSIRIDAAATNRNTISGYAVSKKEVAALRDAMEKSDKIEYVDIESSTTIFDSGLKREVENFSLTFSLSKGALK